MNSRLNPQAELNAQSPEPNNDFSEAQSWNSRQDVVTSRLNQELMTMDNEYEGYRDAYDHETNYLKQEFKELEMRKDRLASTPPESKVSIALQKTQILALEQTVAKLEEVVKNSYEAFLKADYKYYKWRIARGNKIHELVFGAINKLKKLEPPHYTRVLANSASSTASTPLSVLSSSLSSMLGLVKTTVTGFLADPEVQKTLVNGIAGSLMVGSVSSLGMFAQNTSTPAQLDAPQYNNTRLNF